MKDRKKNKTSKQKKALALSLLLAALIVIGTTFAWFTSSDEVTNKLTASNSYGVSITESFTPPEQWTPGQEINKDVSVVNTGNVAAFVEVELSNSIELTVYDTTGYGPDSTSNSKPDDVTYVTITEEEAIALQAGGILMREPGTDGDHYPDGVAIESGTIYGTSGGVYIFARSVGEDDNGNEILEYSGYYVGTDDKGNTVYYKLTDIARNESNSNGWNWSYVVTKSVSDAELEFDYTHISETTPYIVATYDPDKTSSSGETYTDSNASNKIIINIYLANVGTNSDWTFDSTNSTTSTAYFYYNHVLAAGATSAKLVEAVELDDNVTNEAFADFTYDLTVGMNSVQAVTNEGGEVLSTSVAKDATGWTMYVASDDAVTATVDSNGNIVVSNGDTGSETSSETGVLYTNTVTWTANGTSDGSSSDSGSSD